MKKAIMISIQPKWVELIAAKKKTVELRKTRPNLDTPFKSYIYMTRINWAFGFLRRLGMKDLADRLMHATGKIIGEFVCDKIDAYDYEYCTHPEIGMDYDCGDNWFAIADSDLEQACLSYKEFRNYAGNKDVYGWHISDLVIYDEPKRLSEFRRWEEYGTDLRPCQNGVPCEHEVFDYSEDCTVCGIDFDGDNCPFYKVQRPPQSWCYVEPIE